MIFELRPVEGGTEVEIDRTPCEGVDVLSPTELTCTTAPSEAGSSFAGFSQAMIASARQQSATLRLISAHERLDRWLPFDSEAARKLSTQIAETIYFHALRTSMELARE